MPMHIVSYYELEPELFPPWFPALTLYTSWSEETVFCFGLSDT